jgi:hypothetical protein
MLTLSENLVPLPPGHTGARAISSLGLSTIVAFIAASTALPVVGVIGVLPVSLRLTMLPAVVSSTEETLLEAMVAKPANDFDVDSEDDACLDDAISDSLFSGQAAFVSQAFFEQHPLNPVDGQE